MMHEMFVKNLGAGEWLRFVFRQARSMFKPDDLPFQFRLRQHTDAVLVLNVAFGRSTYLSNWSVYFFSYTGRRWVRQATVLGGVVWVIRRGADAMGGLQGATPRHSAPHDEPDDARNPV